MSARPLGHLQRDTLRAVDAHASVAEALLAELPPALLREHLTTWEDWGGDDEKLAGGCANCGSPVRAIAFGANGCDDPWHRGSRWGSFNVRTAVMFAIALGLVNMGASLAALGAAAAALNR